MPFLELSLICRDRDAAKLEAALEDLGALSVTLLDADAATPNEHAILEPGVGETPLWQALRLNALFAADTPQTALAHALDCATQQVEWQQLELRQIDDQDWTRAWMDQYQPMRFGRRLWIYPWNIEPEGLPEDAVVVRLDPGLAFGSGTHPTTALCLEWLDGLELSGCNVLDYGCGSGVLAIAALKLGAAAAVAIDNDPQALLASVDNAQRNDLSGRLRCSTPQDAPPCRYPVVVANILAGALDQLAEALAAAVAPGGRIALSGILHGQHEALLLRYAPWFEALQVATREDWVRIDGRRRNDAAVA